MTNPSRIGSATTVNTVGAYVATSTTSVAVGAGTNRCLVVAVQTNNGNNAPSSLTMTWNGQSLIQLGTAGNTGQSEQIAIFYLPELLLSTTTANLVITAVGVTQWMAGFVQLYGNVDQNLPWSEPRYTYNSSNTTPSVTAPTISGDLVVGVIALFDPGSAYSLTATAPASEIGQVLGGANSLSVSVADSASSGTTLAIAWAVSSATAQSWLLAAGLRSDSTSPQIARPTSDVSVGSWTQSTGASVFATLDETTQDDSDFATDGGNTTMEVGLAALTDPVSSIGHAFGFRWKGGNALTVSLRQGSGTQIATFSATKLDNPPTAGGATQASNVLFQEDLYTLSSVEADAITNYADLRLRFVSAATTQVMPIFYAAGAFTSGAAGLTVAPPSAGTYGINDLMLLFVETANEAMALPTGWTAVTNSPQGTGTAAAAGGVRLTVFWKFATSDSEASVSLTDSGDHQTAQILVYRGVNLTTPFNTTAGSVQASATTAMSFPTVTTTGDNCLIVLACAQDTDLASTATCSGYTNAALSNITERIDQTVITGAGGGLVVADAGLAVAGVAGATSATGSTVVTHAYITMALNPQAATPNAVSFAAFEVPRIPIQTLRPASDISAGLWVPSSGVDLYAMLNETVASDAEYDWAPASSSSMTVKFSAGTSPGVTTGHIVRYRIRSAGNMTVSLMQGASVIKSWTHAPAPRTYTTFAQTLSGAEAATISDYTDLRLKFDNV